MQGDDGHDEYSEAEEEGVYSEELSGSEAAGGRRAEVAAAVAASEATPATTPRRSRGQPSGRGITRILLRGRPSSTSTASVWVSGTTRAAPWRRRSCWRSGSRLTTGTSVATICDRDYMLRRGCPCCRD